MFFWNKFCGKTAFFIIAITNAPACFCQHSLSVSAFNNVFLKNNSSLSFTLSDQQSSFPQKNTIFYHPAHRTFSDLNEVKSLTTNNITTSNVILPGDFSTCNSAFFCRQELKLEKKSHLPIRIRLGSLAQCNYYEGKR